MHHKTSLTCSDKQNKKKLKSAMKKLKSNTWDMKCSKHLAFECGFVVVYETMSSFSNHNWSNDMTLAVMVLAFCFVVFVVVHLSLSNRWIQVCFGSINCIIWHRSVTWNLTGSQKTRSDWKDVIVILCKS